LLSAHQTGAHLIVPDHRPEIGNRIWHRTFVDAEDMGKREAIRDQAPSAAERRASARAAAALASR